jgi:hypothetical protein
MSIRIGLLVILSTLAAATAAAQESRPCTVTRTLVETERTILLRCNQVRSPLPSAVEVHVVRKTTPGDPQVALDKIADASLQDDPVGGPQWKRIILPATAPALAAGHRYFVHIPPSAGSAPASGGTWKSFWQEIATEFEAVITDSPGSWQSGRVLRLATGIALRPAPTASLTLTENGAQRSLPAVVAVAQPAPVGTGADPDMLGVADITLRGARLPVGKVKLTVSGVSDVFGTPVNTAAKARTEILGRKLSGLTKDEVATYLKFAHQAGHDAKPAFGIDSKVAVELPRMVSGWRVTPTATVDVGFGTSKASNAINLGVGFTRFDLLIPGFDNPREPSQRPPTPGFLQGARVSAKPTLEANRDFNKKNAIADLDAEWFFNGFYNPLQKQNRLRLLAARRAQNNPNLEMDEIAASSFGWAITSHLGAEVGRALDAHEETFETGEGDSRVSTTVVAEAHAILRLRPRLGLLLEFPRFSLNAQATGRLLLTEEEALIESNKTFARHEFDGWQGYGEITLSIPLSPRTAIDSTWKNGRQPPTYQRVNLVQTGLAFRF